MHRRPASRKHLIVIERGRHEDVPGELAVRRERRPAGTDQRTGLVTPGDSGDLLEHRGGIEHGQAPEAEEDGRGAGREPPFEIVRDARLVEALPELPRQSDHPRRGDGCRPPDGDGDEPVAAQQHGR